jgi:23S rRNA (pseudouridine1915-N3)-methyltransferase
VIRATDREANVVKLRLIAVGKIREPYVARACDDFRARLRRHESFDEIEVAASHGGDPERAMREEGDRILKLIVASEPLWLLEREGDSFASVELAERLQTLADAGTSRLTIVVAGTYGASPALLARADVAWSLSRLTFLHEWARAIVLEQLYRASKIARNEPYHH